MKQTRLPVVGRDRRSCLFSFSLIAKSILWVWAFLFVASPLPHVRSGWAADINYIYDEVGRLRAVIDPASDTAVYNYDAVGNLLSITRQSSNTVSVIEFNPDTGPVGTAVTLFGTGFSTTPSQNTVTFNGVTATVTASTANQIVTTVPAGATTGLIGVTSPSGSTSSATAFTVTSTGTPTITGFSPTIGLAGTSVTVTGTNFETVPSKNSLRLNIAPSEVSSATTTNLSTTVPTGTGSGRFTVSTSRGNAVSNDDFFIPPSPYTVTDVAYTGRMAIGGSTHTVTIGTANKIGLVVFDGTVGQKVSLGINSSSLSTLSDLYVFNPNGSTLGFDATINVGDDLHVTLPATSTYSILIDPHGTSTGNATLTLSTDVDAGTIVIDGASVTATTTKVGQRAWLTFSGTAGQKVSLGPNSSSLSTLSDLYVFNPDGSTLGFAGTIFLSNTNLHMTLPATGTYSILIDPEGTITGSVTLTLSTEIDAGAITVNGSSIPVTITRVGQRARLTFSGTASQQATVRLTSNSMGLLNVALLKPDGGLLTSSNSSSGSFDLSTQTLPTTGTYTVLVDPAGTNTGSINVAVTNP